MFLLGCSTSKNTSISRHYHALTTKYNIMFNGKKSFDEGIDKISTSNKDDYSQLIPIFPISNHANASIAKSEMDRSIEKCRKAIKLHSIKKKPEKDYKKYNNPHYQAFYNQTEFNPELKKVWLMLGQSEFYKGDFLGSTGTFSYVKRLYASDPEMVIAAQVWQAKGYVENDWIYEAENLLQKIKPNQVSDKNAGFYASTWAEVLIKKGEYQNAVSYLKTAVENEKNRKEKTRMEFVLAQLMQTTGDAEGAADYYARVLKAVPDYEMQFNALINRAQLLSKGTEGIVKELSGMAKNRNNKDYLDQIYTAIGNIYLNNKDSVKAIENYNLAIQKSTRNGTDKGVALVKTGDIYYKKREYVKAQPYYDEASKIYTKDYFDFERISHRAEILADLAKEYNVVHLQDSLLTLSTMSDDERLAAINRVIEKLKKEEKLKQESQLLAQNKQDDNFEMPLTPIGANAGEWYFYNPMTVNSGKTEFRKKWGNRQLEDDWRRSNKSQALYAAKNENTAIDSLLQNNSVSNDSLNMPSFKQTNDKMSVDYYLAQIPFTTAQKQKSNQQLATSLYNMGFVYKDKIEDFPLALQTFNDFEHRFANDDRVIETLYQRFLMASKQQDFASANSFRTQILTRYSSSKYAQLLQDPDFIVNQQKMFELQDKIYDETYLAFTKSDYQTVFKNTEQVKKKYPLSSLIPQFEFLNALSIGKTADSEKFKESLDSLVTKYPESNISAMSKDILALVKQGNIAQQGGTIGSLLARRAKEDLTPEEQQAQSFSEVKFSPHRLMLITDARNEAINKLQYNLAIFNFSRFKIKNFSFAFNVVDSTRKALSVLNLDSYNEAVWYKNTLASDSSLNRQMKAMNVQPVVISEENFAKLKGLFTLDDYLVFQKEVLSKDVPNALLAAADVPKPEKKTVKVEIIDGTKLIEAGKENVQPKVDVSPQKTDTSEKPTNQTAVEKKETLPQTGNTNGKATEQTKPVVQKPVLPETTAKPSVNEPAKIVNDKKEEIPGSKSVNLYKNLYTYQPSAPHYVAFYIPRGGRFDFNALKKAVDDYNSANYSVMNLKVTMEEFGKESIIFIGNFTDADIAKSYFLRVLKEPSIVKATSGVNKMNLIITRDNLNAMLQNNALSTYFEFMKEFYLKEN